MPEKSLVQCLRDPEEVRRWFDQLGEEAADEIERLKGELRKAKAIITFHVMAAELRGEEGERK
jgi:hypothetical protein